MCGIAGVASRREAVDRALFNRQRDTLAHRGPDDAGFWQSDDGRVMLGHRRLSIIDLSPLGHQPMFSPNGRVVIVFNGEIYNFRELRRELQDRGRCFRSQSDTEVILAAYAEWGTGFLPRLNGMFALAMFDMDSGLLLLARDRAGEKPLFIHEADGRISFASELKALFADPSIPRRMNVDALNCYLAYGYVSGTQCLIDGIRKLGPGTAMTWNLLDGTTKAWRYWTLPAPARPAPEATAEVLVDELDALLSDAVARQLVADVPVGILLSGGLDSSLVTAMAARASTHPVKTFTISFPGHGGFDEAPFARSVARHFSTEHIELVAEPATVDLLPQLARQFDEPIADSSMVPTYLVSRLIREHATVALGGDGGDELFGGYFHHSWVLQQSQVRRFVPRPLRAVAGWAGSHALPVGTRGRNYLIGMGASSEGSLAGANRVFDPRARARLSPALAGLAPHQLNLPERLRSTVRFEAGNEMERMTAIDFETYLPDDILVKVDRASMLTSLEVRAPFLDFRVIEFAFGRVPARLRATARERKVLLKRLATRLLPPKFDINRKQGFSIPLDAWFKGPWGAFLSEVLLGADARLLSPHAIGDLLHGQRSGRTNSHRLFALGMLELWRREYQVELP